MSSRVRAALGHRFAPIGLAILAVVLTLPSLSAGLVVDDYYLRWTIQGSGEYQGITPSRLDPWRFFDGDRQRTERMRDLGLVPWWVFRDIKGAFWRPLAAATHVVDFRLWPNHPALMHVHSLLWYAGLVASLATLYRRLTPVAWVAGLATLLYVADEARGTAVGLLANRNALLGALFGVLAILTHDRWRRDRWRLGAVAGPVLLAASLLSAEAGVATCAYLLAHALCLDRGAWRSRVAALVPYVAVVLAWRVVWRGLGYGLYGVEEIYNDPAADPLGFAALIVWRAPLYILGQLALPPADFHLVLGRTGAWLMWVGGVAVMVMLAVAMVTWFRGDRVARFWAVGMALALVPACATAASNRQLFFIGVGGMGLMAMLLEKLFSRQTWRIPARGVGVVLIVIHLVIAPIAVLVVTGCPLGPRFLFAACHRVPGMDGAIEQRDLVIVNHPLPAHALHMLGARVTTGRPVPRHTRVLAGTSSALTVYRPDERTLVVRPARGFLLKLTERLFYSPAHPFTLGQQVKLTGMTVTVTELTDDGRPAEARFEFAVPLEDTSLHWVQWKDWAFRPFTPPGIGQTIELPAAALPV